MSKYLESKKDLYKQYFENHRSELDIFKNKFKKYSLDTYLNMYILFEMSGISYNNFMEILNLGANMGKNNYPQKTCFYDFKDKMSNIQINKKIHEKNIDNKLTKHVIIDSTTIINKCNHSNVDFNYAFKNKKCIKVNIITNEYGYPLYCSVGKGNRSDFILGLKLLNENVDVFLKNKFILLGDKGYDSNKLRNILKDMNCDSIIPINKRNNHLLQNNILNENNPDKKPDKKSDKKPDKKSDKKQNKKSDKKPNKKSDKKPDKKSDKKPDKKSDKKSDKKPDKKSKKPDKKSDKKSDKKPDKKSDKKSDKKPDKKSDKKSDKKFYYYGLTSEQIIKYKKRIHVEHCIKDFKVGRVSIVRDIKIKMYYDSIYSRLIDFKFFDRYIK